MEEKYGQKPKQILFNTEMVQAILDGRKGQTRRLWGLNEINKNPDDWGLQDYSKNPELMNIKTGELIIKKGLIATFEHMEYGECYRNIKARHEKGDILYVRETWKNGSFLEDNENNVIKYIYKADDIKCENSYKAWGIKWHPSIHMPKEVARIFLKVTDVRVERLQSISEEDAEAEGVYGVVDIFLKPTKNGHILFFSDTWNKLYKRKGYSWDTNPWIWAIKSERIEANADS
jgi:hypothetical protein